MSDPGTGGNPRRKCSDIMTRNVTTAQPDMTIAEASALLRDGDMGSIPVISDGKLVGIVTDRDIVVRSLADGKGPETPISSAMSTELFTVRRDDFVFEAIRLMGDRQVRRIPVVDNDGSLAGIISMADVALETEDQAEIAETLEEISSGSSFWSKS